jgi:hypothetical protein
MDHMLTDSSAPCDYHAYLLRLTDDDAKGARDPPTSRPPA